MPDAPTSRRLLLSATALIALGGPAAARSIRGALPWSPNEAYPPPRVTAGGWLYFTAEEAASIEAIANRLIPADALGPGGGEAGCAIYLDRQLAGPYGSSSWLYMQGPFARGTPEQGLQDERPPAALYRQSLSAINAHCRARFGGRAFPALSPEEQDALLHAIDEGRSGIAGLEDKPFFEMLLQNVMEGFFADPIYGGNRDMAGWKLLGFPGTRYDYREMLDRPNQPYRDPPVPLSGLRAASWQVAR
ncbi:gluconate 2-dehydrogenase subunit 3 family protein [Siccirubricoccus sp. KC 17139]|uniref:Gluconate 2-dehydrogenase subunit 3 family protein n=1 Tax=Siccirubricoccus soli TaxID=2899147 RepID=A0ABT1D1A4_9PROT|nr:gluconate 2-dehydrogenase subunit 3 family protein [Siccirubricoccus soli]MCO6415662.1 gluconate 2-dehydrogenase subunit 3 family protein [Siccirubricoccus soli]MCP2681794.1 gluconate 2-dehydrogenase subunit 3 family protein [Siccirubricoccus soli]